MPRKSNVALSFEEQRLQIIHKHQHNLRKSLQREVATKKASKRLPGELMWKQNMAIFLKIGIPGISYSEIGARIDETKTTVKKWFLEDPYVREQYEVISKGLKDSALELMEFYAIEAVETLVLLMRFGEEKIMLTSAVEILDRIGIAKLSKSEAQITSKRSHQWEDQSELINEIRQLPPEKQEEAIAMLEGLQNMLVGQSSDSVDDDEDSLKPIVGREEEPDSLEDEDDAAV